jgi:hypothetical protein
MNYHYISTRTVKTTGNKNTKCWGGCGESGPLVQDCWKGNCRTTLETVWQFLAMLNMYLYNPAGTLWGIFPEK